MHNDHNHQREFVPVRDISQFLFYPHPLPAFKPSFLIIYKDLLPFYPFLLLVFFLFPSTPQNPFSFEQFLPISQYLLDWLKEFLMNWSNLLKYSVHSRNGCLWNIQKRYPMWSTQSLNKQNIFQFFSKDCDVHRRQTNL